MQKSSQKKCIITGGANGIGRATAAAFLKEGYFVLILDIDKDAGDHFISQYDSDHAAFYHGDIADQIFLDDFIESTKEEHSQLHALVNNACINKRGLTGCSYEDFNYVLRIGVTAPFYLTQQLMPRFQKGASVVNISSTRAFMSQPDTESYTAAKGGISALTHAMSISLAGRVRVNSISPGWIDTGAFQKEAQYNPQYSNSDIAQHPSGRIGTPEDIAHMILYLCSDHAGFINGENITIDGGMSKLMIYHNDYGWKLELP